MKIIFIGGSPRSGTTLVQKVMVIHSKIAGGNELDYLYRLMPIYNAMIKPEQIDGRQKNFYTIDQLQDYWKTFIENLLSNVFKSKTGAVFLSEKTPANIYVAQTLLDLFPDSKFIYVYRDGRDVISSFKKVYLRKKKNIFIRFAVIFYHSFLWLKIFNIYINISDDKNYKDRIFAIKYEELVASPQSEIKKMMDFIGVDLEDAQLDPSAFDSNDLGMKRIDKGIWYDEKMFTQKISTDNIGKWKKDLLFVEKFIVNTIQANRLTNEGYKVNNIYVKLNWLFFKLIKIFTPKFYKWK